MIAAEAVQHPPWHLLGWIYSLKAHVARTGWLLKLDFSKGPFCLRGLCHDIVCTGTAELSEAVPSIAGMLASGGEVCEVGSDHTQAASQSKSCARLDGVISCP